MKISTTKDSQRKRYRYQWSVHTYYTYAHLIPSHPVTIRFNPIHSQSDPIWSNPILYIQNPTQYMLPPNPFRCLDWVICPLGLCTMSHRGPSGVISPRTYIWQVCRRMVRGIIVDRSWKQIVLMPCCQSFSMDIPCNPWTMLSAITCIIFVDISGVWLFFVLRCLAPEKTLRMDMCTETVDFGSIQICKNESVPQILQSK
jgi:hypothetical protein